MNAVVHVQAMGMKEARCLAASNPGAKATALVDHYTKRCTLEPSFRDKKDLRVGMGPSPTCIGKPTWLDRRLLVSALTMTLLTVLGAVGESLGVWRLL